MGLSSLICSGYLACCLHLHHRDLPAIERDRLSLNAMSSPCLVNTRCIHFFILFSQEYFFKTQQHLIAYLWFQATESVGGISDSPRPQAPFILGCYDHQHWSTKWPEQGVRMDIMSGDICGPALQLEHVTSPCILLARNYLETKLFGPSAKGLETIVLLCPSEENRKGLGNTWTVSARVFLLVTKYIFLLFLPHTEYTHPISKGGSSNPALYFIPSLKSRVSRQRVVLKFGYSNFFGPIIWGPKLSF